MTKVQAWLIAARPRTLWAAVVPVLVGSALVWDLDDRFRWDAFAAALVVAIAVQVGVNFANDASDAARGTDTPDRLGPPRAVATGLLSARQVWTGAALVFAPAGVAGFYLAAISSWWLLAIGVAAVLAAFGYTGGPWPYGYHGLGEVFVFVFFGLVATVGTNYAHDTVASTEAWLLAVPVGLLAVALLVINNIRDIDTDRAAGKRTLAVIIGRHRSRHLFAAVVGVPFVLVVAYAAAGATPPWTALAVLALPLAWRPVTVAYREVGGPALIGALRGTARLQAAFGVLVAAGAIV